MAGLARSRRTRYKLAKAPSSRPESVLEVSISRIWALLFTRIIRSPAARC
jgi:hypothetical protein